MDAPDLLGHGWAPHVPSYTVETLAQHLADNLKGPYDLIGGVSFGSTIAAALYPLLKEKPRRMVLAEPLFDHPAPPDADIEGMVNGTKDIPSEESLLKTFLKWSPVEAILRRLSLNQIDPEAISQLFGVSEPKLRVRTEADPCRKSKRASFTMASYLRRSPPPRPR